MVILLSLDRKKVLHARDLRNGAWIMVHVRKRGVLIKTYRLIVDDPKLSNGTGSPHSWVECKDSAGTRILLHVDPNWRIDRMHNTGKHCDFAVNQIALPFN